MKFNCQHCGAEYRRKPSHFQRTKFCSRTCRSQHTARRTAQARGDLQRGRGLAKAYRKRNGRHEHRIVAEAMLGRPLARGEIVHHIDGNKQNNDPSNLRVMTQAEHMREHGMGIPGKPLPWKPWEYRR